MPEALAEPAVVERFSVLAVDDEPNILAALRRTLRGHGFDVQVAQSGAQALEILATNPVDAIVSDMRMPEMNGADFLREARARLPDAVRILLTGYADIGSTIAAVNEGEIFRYLSKPWDDARLVATLHDGLERKRLARERDRLLELVRGQNAQLQSHAQDLETRVQERTQALAEAHAGLQDAHRRVHDDFAATVRMLASLLDQRDGLTRGCAAAVVATVRAAAPTLGLAGEALQDVLYAAMLEDLGKLGLPDRLLATPMLTLSVEDRRSFVKYPLHAGDHLLAMSALHGASHLLRQRFERHDGNGEPLGLSGSAIAPGARLLAAASDFERVQRGAIEQRRFSREDALRWLRYGAGTRYDPAVVDAIVYVGSAQRKGRRLRTDALQPGMALARDLVVGSVLLLAQGRLLDDQIIRSLCLFERRQSRKLELEISDE